MSGNQNKYTCLVDSGSQVSTISLEHAKELGLEIFDEYGNIVKTTSTKKKSRYSKLQKQLKSLEDKYDILDNDLDNGLTELRWEVNDIKKSLLDMKCPALQKIQSKKKNKVIRDSNSSDNESESE